MLIPVLSGARVGATHLGLRLATGEDRADMPRVACRLAAALPKEHTHSARSCGHVGYSQVDGLRGPEAG